MNAAGCKEGGESIVNKLSAVISLNSSNGKAELCLGKAAEVG